MKTHSSLVSMSVRIPAETKTAVEALMDGKFFGPPHADGGLPVIQVSTASDAVDYLIQAGLRKMLEDVNAGLEQRSAHEQETLEILNFFKRNPTANRAYAGDFEEGTAVKPLLAEGDQVRSDTHGREPGISASEALWNLSMEKHDLAELIQAKYMLHEMLQLT